MNTSRSAARALTWLAVLAVSTLLTACGVTAENDSAGGGSSEAGTGAAGGGEPLTDLQFMVPNTAGGGYDVTARTAAKVMEDAGIAEGVEVFNLAGAGGTVGLARTVNERGNADLIMMMGLGVVGAEYTNDTEATLKDTTPLAKLIEEAGAIFVPADSPYETLDDLITAWKADPAGVAVGGGSSPGGPDHLLPMQLAEVIGIDPTEVNFVSYDGGGDLLPAILGGKVAFGASGYTEFLDQVEAGDLRVLGVTSEERIDVLQDAPTLQEQGVDLLFTNWRGVVAPPEIADADRQALIAALQQMHDSDEWKAAMEENGWTDAFITGDEFQAFLEEQDAAVAEILTRLGLAS